MRAIAALCKTDWASRESLPFAGQVYRVRRVGGVRYAYIKATAGVLRVRDEVNTARGTQKVSALMLPQGGKLTTLGELSAEGRRRLRGWMSAPENASAQS